MPKNVHHYLTKAAYIWTYSNVIHPILDEALWPQVKRGEVLPPMKRKMLERPKKNRKRQPDEPAKKKRKSGMQCGSCGEWSHNLRTCKGRGENAKGKKCKE
ncbi:hypothetical protein Dsin_000107 [Dipteronia sinensis]|uniref:Uncharacterized protein n=1 Tax=Dipteronia sinensis TaxID=43782 RepID=A0AAD9Z4Z3_9ROSI|nr:hypothetical protein Dsin_000107 [Dipteronia sinensis]